MDQPRVDVYVPTYNRARYLRVCIESILEQTFTDFRLIVSDNASTDETPEVVAAFDDPRVEYVRRPENLGLFGNFSACINEARAEYVLMFADDELLYPEHLERTVRVLDAQPNAGMVHTAFDIIGPEGEVVFPATNWTGVDGDRTEPGEEFIRGALASWTQVSAATVLLRREAIPERGYREDDFPPTDFAMWMRLALSWDIAFLSDTLAGYRIHPTSHSAYYGTYTDAGYIDTPELIVKGLEVKLRFIDENRHRFPDADRLRDQARRFTAWSLVNRVGRATLPERRRLQTARLLGDAVRRQPRVLRESAAWKLMAASLLGPSLVDRIKARRHHPQMTSITPTDAA
jgi:glycosyltransferase involved in cell wall biosynthesis